MAYQVSGELIDKIICGLRQVTRDMLGRAGRDVTIGDIDEHGIDLEAMEQYADRINGYAAELDAERPPLPNVYWSDEGCNFYDRQTRKGMGVEFFKTWFARRGEFPQ